MFIAALFIVTRNREKPRYPSTGEWIKTMVQTHDGIPANN